MTRDDQLAQCLDTIIAGQATLEAVMQQQPDLAEELLALIETAQFVQTTVEQSLEFVMPRPHFRETARQNLLEALPSRQLAPPSQTISQTGWRHWFATRRRFAIALPLLLLLLFTGIGGGTLYAASNALPGNRLYPLKTRLETAQRERADEPNEIVALELHFADTRLTEIEKLVANKSTEYVTHTSKRYAEHLDAVMTTIHDIDDNALQAEETALLAAALKKDKPRLTTLEKELQQIALPDVSIQSAMTASQAGSVYVETGIVTSEKTTLFDILKDPRFSFFRAALEKDGKVNWMLINNGPFTLFAPTDEAIRALPAGVWDTVNKNPTTLRQTLLYHIVKGRYTAKQLPTLGSDPTALGIAQLQFQGAEKGGVLLNNKSKLTTIDIPAANGILHIIDYPLLPNLTP